LKAPTKNSTFAGSKLESLKITNYDKSFRISA
jgi:hypothetical protein